MPNGSCWSKVIPILQDAGHSVVAVQLPLTSIADDAATARRATDKFDAPVVVVGHSFGGVVITQAAYMAPNVSALVYVAAFAPDANESAADLVGRFPALESAKYIVVDKSGFSAFPQDQFPRLFGQDVDPVEARVLAAVQDPRMPRVSPSSPDHRHGGSIRPGMSSLKETGSSIPTSSAGWPSGWRQRRPQCPVLATP
jgi:pimeloyl-ACP methyl ester carboxylesterase